MAELTQSTLAPRRARTPRLRGVLALTRERLQRTLGGRIAGLFRVLLLVFFVGAAVLVRASDGGNAPLSGLVSAAAGWLAWLVGAPLALAAAHDREARDRADGIDALAAARGFSAEAMRQARVLGAMLEITAAIGVPLLALAGLTIAFAGSLRLALYRVSIALGAAAFAAVAGVALGGIGAAAGRLGRARGRLLLVAVIAGPWILADLTGHRAFSIPGALAAVLDFTLGGAGA